jgi:hypothetical protein
MHALKQFSRSGLSLSAAVLAVALAGCAQTSQPGYFNPAPASTTKDAIEFAEGGVSQRTVHAPSQIQIKLRPDQQTQATDRSVTQASAQELTGEGRAQLEREIQADQSPKSTLISKPQTFFGTMPCFHQDMRCTAQQVTLTLAPNGRWRARVAYFENQQVSGNTMTDQGCWRSIPMRPPRIILMDADRNVRAELSMHSPDTLRLRSIDGETPNLIYTLSKQPDVDPISELDQAPPPNCN